MKGRNKNDEHGLWSINHGQHASVQLYNVSAFERKTQFKGNIWENCQKNFLKNCEKCIILADFRQNLANPALIFCAFGRKTQVIGKFENILETC